MLRVIALLRSVWQRARVRLLPAGFVQQALKLIEPSASVGSASRSDDRGQVASEAPSNSASYSPSDRSSAGGRLADSGGSPGRARIDLNPPSPSKCAGSTARCRWPAQAKWTAGNPSQKLEAAMPISAGQTEAAPRRNRPCAGAACQADSGRRRAGAAGGRRRQRRRSENDACHC
jgi:hypothetical protein